MSNDGLAIVRAKAAELRDLEAEISSVQERLAGLNAAHFRISRKELPELMQQYQITAIELEAQGNQPAFTAKLSSYYRAGIAADWEQEKRQEGFAYLESVGAADLIKTTIVIALPREDRATAKKLIKQLDKYGPEVKEQVHHATLTAWLKEKTEAGEMVELTKIGGDTGQIVLLKPVKENTTRKAKEK